MSRLEETAPAEASIDAAANEVTASVVPAASEGPALTSAEAAALYAEIGSIERQLGDHQARYRAAAAFWLLATFGGAAWSLTTDPGVLAVHPLLLTTAVGVAGAAGQVLLWNLDLMVTSRELDAVRIEALRLEQRNTGLPPVRHNMMALYGGRGVLERVANFYYLAVVLCAVVGGLAMTAWTAELRPELTGWVAAAAAAAAGLTVASMKSATGHTRQMLGNLARSTRAAQARREMEAREL